jgi:thiol-activated cytolysin
MSWLEIVGEAATGLAWSPRGKAISVTEDAPTNKTYRIFGTTLRRKHEISD